MYSKAQNIQRKSPKKYQLACFKKNGPHCWTFGVLSLIFGTFLSVTQLPALGADKPLWPARVFAPYLYLGAGDNFKMTAGDAACGLKHYTLAFIIARQEGRGRETKYFKEPSWYGRVPMEQDFYKDQIDEIRKRGGDVIVSIGGEAGRELAIIIEDPAELQAAYQSIVDRYHFTWLDFDIEGSNLDKHAEASTRRNAVLAALQAKNPGLRVSYTLPVDPDGVSQASQALLTDAKAKGLKVYSANLMVMFFGKRFIHKGKSEGELGIDSAMKARDQIQKIDPAVRIGLCPCLGNNGSKEEVFTLDDAKVLKGFADKTPWVCSLHYWSINDDAKPRRKKSSGGEDTNSVAGSPDVTPTPWAFAKLFKSFASAR
jgi:chitinase